MENKEKSERAKIKELLTEIYKGNLTIEEIKLNFIELYLMNKNLIDNAYRLYLNDKVKAPEWRLNLLLTGTGGTGKTTLANLLAQELDKKEAFTFTDIEAGFNEYSDQNIIIWDEMRSNYIKEWGINRFLTATNNGPFNTARIKVLYGVVKLGQHYNLITTSEPYRDFLEGLTERSWEDTTHTKLTAPENPDQISRRFNYFIDFNATQLDRDTKEVNITFYSFNPMINTYYVFTDKYEIIKKWTIKTTEENYIKELKKIAKEIAKNINGKKINIDNLK